MSQTTENTLMLCHRCGTMCKGNRGLAVHLSKREGDSLHPPSINVEDGEYTEIPADENWNPQVDQSELAELHSEITADIHEFDLYKREAADSQPSDEHLQELIEQAVIPEDVTKVRKVAALIDQVPELHDRPDLVKDAVNCSTTTYYDGRNLYDLRMKNSDQSNSEQSVSPSEESEPSDKVEGIEEIVWDEGKSLVINGERYVPMEEYQRIVKTVNESVTELNEVGNRGAQIIQSK